MPNSKEYVSTSDDDSSEEEVKSSKAPKRETQDKLGGVSKKPKQESNEDDDNAWDLGGNRRISVRVFKEKLYVDIREMYYDKHGKLKPGKKGICLNMSQWRKLLLVVQDVDKVVESKR